MFSCSSSLLLVLLVLTCLQSFIMAYNGSGPEECCFNYNKKPIGPASIIAYSMTRSDCTKPGVVFATKDGKRTCVNPKDKWVKVAMKKINKRLKMFQSSKSEIRSTQQNSSSTAVV